MQLLSTSIGNETKKILLQLPSMRTQKLFILTCRNKIRKISELEMDVVEKYVEEHSWRG